MTKSANEIRNAAKLFEFVCLLWFLFFLKDAFSTSFKVGNVKKWFCPQGLASLPPCGLWPVPNPYQKVLAHLLAFCLGLGLGSGSEWGDEGCERQCGAAHTSCSPCASWY